MRKWWLGLMASCLVGLMANGVRADHGCRDGYRGHGGHHHHHYHGGYSHYYGSPRIGGFYVPSTTFLRPAYDGGSYSLYRSSVGYGPGLYYGSPAPGCRSGNRSGIGLYIGF